MTLEADLVKFEKEEACSVCPKMATEFYLIRDYAINLEYRACSERCAIIKLVLSNHTLELMYKGEWTDPYELVEARK
ncbi:MAG: hypothetical protein V1839_01950 [archaeon]